MDGARDRLLSHTPVLQERFVAALIGDPDGLYVDCTFGRGGHSRIMLDQLSQRGRLLGLDRDPEAVSAGQQLAAEDDRFTMAHADFAQLEGALDRQGWEQVNGIGFDLGISSPQVDDPKRGFSFQQAGPLDMRMDPTSGAPLSRLLKRASESELIAVLKDYGDERYARRIAREIIAAERGGKLNSTADLEAVCFHAVPRQARHGKTHPATRTFQALRIWVNEEMDQIDQGIRAAMRRLLPGGRLAVISFHSGEDRRVRDLIEAEVNPCVCPPQAPYCICGKLPTMRWLQKKPLRASEAEMSENPRSRSALLRVAERISEEEAQLARGYVGGVA